jgi:electron transfer flavoprotein alpha subunit
MMMNTLARTVSRRAFTASRNASTLVVADLDGAAMGPSTLSAVTAAVAIGGDCTVLAVGDAAAAAECGTVDGVSKVLHAATDSYVGGETVASAIASAMESGSYTHIIAASSNLGKNAIPRAAAKAGASPVTDVIEVHGEDTFVRPMYAGNALAKVKNSDAVKFMTVRPTNFDKAGTGNSAAVEALSFGSADASPEFVSASQSQSDRPDLSAADVVVAGGRGMKNGENFGMLETLADKLGGAVGASRAAVDAGFVPNELQVGQTGKVVAPNLYVAVGISGAIQHLSGMKDSKTIVAINKDKEAPIFSVSDYGLVADLFDAVPEFTEKC